ncbi:glutathione S-transferase family protein [Limnoraphis robusta Tam1]|uniref:glutathione S-transferase family protein n=1 Tax=Limnoraphis robusta TaxID=1118279 RepID=UPI002B20880B|nr:glutathione S-transferase family protein [Limnoraphis robusta]MEA5541977.1 glutathione S-transferase family protein [Limnoraphis robusta Tam1]
MMSAENLVHSQSSQPILFYANPYCPYAQRSWITLRQLNIPFSYEHIELGKDNKTDWFLALNPNGAVPVIKQNDLIIYESLVINEYLSEVFGNPENKLLPENPVLKAKARILISRCDAKFVKLAYTYLSHKPTDSQENTAKDEELRNTLEAELRFLDDILAESQGRYFLGEILSLVDIAFIPFFERMLVALETWKGFNIKSLNFNALNRWLDAMSSLDSYQGTQMEPEKIKEVYSRFLGSDYFKKVGIAN